MDKRKRKKLLKKLNATSPQLNLLVIRRANQINSKLQRCEKMVVAGAECGRIKEHGLSGFLKRKHYLQPSLESHYESKLGVKEGEMSTVEKRYPVGNCAECEAVNKVICKNNNININIISVSLAVGCRKFDIICPCHNCDALFFKK